MKDHPIIVVGAGLAGLTACLQLIFEGHEVLLVAEEPSRMSYSASWNSPIHLPDIQDPSASARGLLSLGASLIDWNLLCEFIEETPRLFEILQRLGIPLDRTDEGIFKDYSDGDPSHRSFRAGYLSARHILNQLTSLLQREAAKGKVRIQFNTRFLAPVLDSKQICRGIVAWHKPTLELQVLPAHAVIVATGGYEGLFESSLHPQAFGSAIGALFRQGAMLANPEMIQMDACLAGNGAGMSLSGLMETLRPRFFVQKEGRAWYFLEDLYLQHKNNLPQAVLCGAIQKMGATQPVFADIDNERARRFISLSSAFADHLKMVTGPKASLQAIPVSLRVSDTLGGLWTDQRYLTSLPGILAAGRVQHQLKGAHQGPGMRIFASLFSGLKAADNAALVAEGLKKTAGLVPDFLFDEALKSQFSRNRDIMDQRGGENVYHLIDEVRALNSRVFLGPRDARSLKSALDSLRDIVYRMKEVQINDRSGRYNQELLAFRSLEEALPLAEASFKAALYRNESRGVHKRSDFPSVDDQNFLKTTRVRYGTDGARIEYEDIAVERAQWMRTI